VLTDTVSPMFSPDGHYLITTSDAGAQVWDLTQLATPLGVLEEVSGISFSPDGHYLAGALSDENSWGLWELPKLGAPLTVLTDTAGVAFSPDGRHLVAGGAQMRFVDIAEPAAPIELRRPPDSKDTFDSILVRFSPDGRYLAVTGSYQTFWNLNQVAFIWDARTPTDGPVVLRGHEGTIQDMAFSPDGSHLATGDSSGALRLWNLADLTVAPVVLRGHAGSVFQVMYSSDGHHLASGGRDGVVRLWELRPDELHRMACATAGRNLAWSEWQQAIGDDYRKTCADLPVHRSLIDEAAGLMDSGNPAEALALMRKATALGPAADIPASAWNKFCWWASLAGHAADARNACETAVALAPHDGNLRDSRGIARAVTGDLKGASEDFKAFVAWAKTHDISAEVIARREAWIAALAAGRNPIDAQTLKELHDE
jgi:WD40 repeat protein